MSTIIPYIYLLAAVFFILALKGLASPVTARKGNVLGIMGMALAILATLFKPGMHNMLPMLGLVLIGGTVGTLIALKVNMTHIPQLVAGFHSLVGLAAVFVALCAFLAPEAFSIGTSLHIYTSSLVEMSIGLIIGAITFSGSVVAFTKLQGWVSGQAIKIHAHATVNIIVAVLLLGLLISVVFIQNVTLFFILGLLSLLFGVLLIIPIGGADMPVVISMLNSYSGWAAAGIGFTLNNHLLIITGALVGASGAILSYVMCKGMNRSLVNVIFGGLSNATVSATLNSNTHEDKQVQQANGEDAAFLLSKAKDVIIVPGYGMAVSQAQHAIKELCVALEKRDIRVRFAIHPVAGRMPGHMNVLLAEANIPYDRVFEQDEINRDFANCDIAYVIGANDITNPSAKTDASSPIYGMPVLEVEQAKNILFIKRSLAPGYSGVDNDLFYRDNTHMLFDDAKKMTESIIKSLASL